MSNFKDLTGQTFGRLVVVKRVENKGKRVAYLCKCNCGNEFVTTAPNLTRGDTRSCGCLKMEVLVKRVAKHKKTNTRLYRIWKIMKTRCYNKHFHKYNDYGARGIIVCDEWKNDFVAFEKWANNNGYNDTLTIDRIDFNGNYEPSNCRWATAEEQANNRRSLHYIEYDGKKRTISDWAKELNLSPATIVMRLKRGWPIEKTLSSKKYKNNGKSY